MHRLLLALTLLITACAFSPAPPRPAIPLKPFTIDHITRVDSPADVSFLLGKEPAGKDGFITARGAHLFKPNGDRWRAWGVNLTGWTTNSTNLPTHSDARLWAAEMARYGINCVRFHFLDLENTHYPRGAEGRRRRPDGLVISKRDDTQHFDPAALDRLDFFVNELKQRGIYSDLNLNVGRIYKSGDNVPDNDLITQAKGMTYFGERLLELQRDYARQLLTHRNPYTNTDYCHEPAIAIVEIVNENSIYEFWDRNWLRGERVKDGPRNFQLDLTPFYSKQLDGLYNDWLAQTRTPEELEQLRKISGVGSGAPIPRLHRGSFATAPREQFHAEADFYAHIEQQFFDDFKKFLRQDLGVQSLILGTADHTYWIPNQPLLRSTSRMDMVDGHVYWQHPAIWGKRNTPMVNDPLHSTIVKLSRSPMVDKPYTVSEVNHPNPNEYAAEMIPILAAYAGFQDWDGIFFYTFETKSDGKAEPNFQRYPADNFDITQDPVKMIQMASGALMFLRGDIAPASEMVTRTYSHEQINETMRMPESARPYFTPGFPLSLPLRHGSRIACLDCDPTGPLPAEPFNADSSTNTLLSDTGQLAWRTSESRGGLVTIDTPRTQSLVGFVRDNARKTTTHLAADVKNDFCAITLSSLDGNPISRSDRMLLTACSKIENTGTQWNERRTLWSTWGHAPSLIEPVTGWLTLHDLEGPVALQLQPLDGAAKPIGKPINGRRLEEGWEIPLGNPATTFYLITVVR